MPRRSRFCFGLALAILVAPGLALAEPCAQGAEDPEGCARQARATLEEIERDEARAAAAPSAERRALLEQTAQRYDAAVVELCSAAETAPSELCQQLTDASERVWIDLGRTGRAIAIHRRFVGVAPPAERARSLVRLGDLYRRIGAFELAADFYERGAESGGDRAESAWVEAADLRVALGDDQGARATFGRARQALGRRAPGSFVDIGLGVATTQLSHDSPARARATLLSLGRALEAAPLDSRVRAHVLLARSSPRPSGHVARAMSEVDFANVDEIADRIRDAWPDQPDEAISRRIDRAIDAVAEAALLSADEARVGRLRDLRPPTSVAGLEAWVVDAVASVDHLIADHYAKVTILRPSPSRRWIALAASRAAFTWADLIEQLRSPALVIEGSKQPAFAAALDAATRFISRERAAPAFVTCHMIGGTIAWTAGSDRRAPRDCVGALRVMNRRSSRPSDEPMFSLFELSSSPAAPLGLQREGRAP